MYILFGIKTIKLSKQLEFPSTNENNENGVREFMYDMDNEIVHVDKDGFEDLITFHEAAFEITNGYYFNEGRNHQIKKKLKTCTVYDFKLKTIKVPHRLLLNY